MLDSVGRERKGQTGDRTRDYPIHAGRSATELPSRFVEESSTPTDCALHSSVLKICKEAVDTIGDERSVVGIQAVIKKTTRTMPGRAPLPR